MAANSWQQLAHISDEDFLMICFVALLDRDFYQDLLFFVKEHFNDFFSAMILRVGPRSTFTWICNDSMYS